MGNLFSTFDPNITINNSLIRLNWVVIFLVVFIIPQGYWIVKSQYRALISNIFYSLIVELVSIFRIFIVPGSIYIYLGVFIFLLLRNFLGLVPYIFTRTRHLVISLTISLPLWVGTIIISIIYQYNNLFSHLVPTGTPPFLMPVIVIIETIRNFIRPFTLAIRLAANIVAGHLLLTLLGSQGPSLNTIRLILLILFLVLLIFLEIAVACIQSYVFTVLRSLYLRELSRRTFNTLMLK